LTGVLAEILAHKRGEVEQARRECPLDQLKSRPGYYLPRRNFYGAVTAPGRNGPNLIAEVKRSSPSAGLIQPDFDPVRIARHYAAGGARALSVLTDEKYFGGKLEYLAQIKAAVGLPVLRKDFLVDAYQVYESRSAGADAVLVIGDALDATLAGELVGLARSLELCVLLEVHTRAALLAALDVLHADVGGNVLLGINNRDLATQTVDLSTLDRLASLVPPGVPMVSESGVKTRADVKRLHDAGARAILVGETLMRSGDPQRTIRELFG
jgi:indole-3-glycerol phosphate synthase